MLHLIFRESLGLIFGPGNLLCDVAVVGREVAFRAIIGATERPFVHLDSYGAHIADEERQLSEMGVIGCRRVLTELSIPLFELEVAVAEGVHECCRRQRRLCSYCAPFRTGVEERRVQRCPEGLFNHHQ